MANLTIAAADVAPIRSQRQVTAPAAEAISAGQWVRYDTTTGKLALGNGTDAAESRDGFLALRTVIANESLTAVGEGSLVDVGDALDALTYDDDVFLSDTDGTLADSAGTVSKIVARVAPAWSSLTADKILELV
ncbi:MAG: hypothetical protein GY938_12785 [Ketobacter sp.]|nr:hypothetical protein [Ketobacter sp.]